MLIFLFICEMTAGIYAFARREYVSITISPASCSYLINLKTWHLHKLLLNYINIVKWPE